ncbi:hypothetical protein [Hyphococcus luteus]|nr:hypothetical protein [Marinicaulis flavus]
MQDYRIYYDLIPIAAMIIAVIVAVMRDLTRKDRPADKTAQQESGEGHE